jgi:hypothetical protein
MITNCLACGLLVDLRRSVTGAPVLLDPVPHQDGRWARGDAETARFVGSKGRYRNHRTHCRDPYPLGKAAPGWGVPAVGGLP